MGGVPLITVNKVRLTGMDMIQKTILDYMIAIPVALFLLPFFITMFILVKRDSPGPFIYRRRVMGVNGKEFDAYKIRTMRQDSDAYFEKHPELWQEYEQNFKLKDDPRITRLGQFLRKSSLDELPQIFNVLKNEMSIVGPRMISPPELKKYNQFGTNLLTVCPGITGLWQVSGRSDVSYEERVRLDMHYIRNWSIWLDIQIILQTIPAILKRRGAY
jgi:lipopolysaccharide/colanic/teichoic acid biosynthesis glycosyltransferase